MLGEHVTRAHAGTRHVSHGKHAPLAYSMSRSLSESLTPALHSPHLYLPFVTFSSFYLLSFFYLSQIHSDVSFPFNFASSTLSIFPLYLFSFLVSCDLIFSSNEIVSFSYFSYFVSFFYFIHIILFLLTFPLFLSLSFSLFLILFCAYFLNQCTEFSFFVHIFLFPCITHLILLDAWGILRMKFSPI